MAAHVKVEGCQPKNIFLLAGQSNMSGRGGNYDDTDNIIKWDGEIPPECTPSPNILRLNANKSWEEAHDPLHKDIDCLKTCGIGPGMPFASAILAKDPSFGSIGLVPCAIGGTRMVEWARGAALYNQLVDRAKASLNGSEGKIRALLWYQGESDTSLQDSRLYKGRFEKFISDLRQDLDQPDLPIIMVRILFISVIKRVVI
jgi:hypothetical protein